MKKFISFILVIFLVSFVFAEIGLTFDIGGHYANEQRHKFGTDVSDFHTQVITMQHMGGFDIGVNYEIAKGWGVFFNSAFSFNNLFLNDSLLGFGYTFKMDNSDFKVFLGGGLAFGGLIYKTKKADITTSYFNLGAGVQVVGSYMFKNKFGVFFGADLNYYGVLSGNTKIKIGDKTSKNEIDKKLLPSMAKSFHLKAGLRIGF